MRIPVALALCLSLVLGACAEHETASVVPIDAVGGVPVVEFHAPDASEVDAAVRYGLDRQFSTLVTFYLQDEVKSFGRGTSTAIGDMLHLVTTTAEDARRIYAHSHADGDARFLNKPVLLSGVVLGVSKGKDNVPYVVLLDGVMLGTQARLEPASFGLASSIKKEQDLALVCVGTGFVGGTPVFSDCRLAAAVAQDYARLLAGEFVGFARGKTVSREATELAVRFESLARAVEDGVDCAKGCENRVDYRHAADMRTLGTIVRKMRAGGLRVDPETERRLTGVALVASR